MRYLLLALIAVNYSVLAGDRHNCPKSHDNTRKECRAATLEQSKKEARAKSDKAQSPEYLARRQATREKCKTATKATMTCF